MARETKYVCDKCGHEQENHTQMWNVKVFCEHVGHAHSGTFAYHNPQKQEMWCRKCTEAVGLNTAMKDKDQSHVIQPPPTLDELVRKFIDEAVEEAAQNF